MATPNTLRGLATITFFANDLSAARQWYANFLGMDAYFAFPKEGDPAYIEFRIGDYQHELGLIDAKYAPQPQGQPGGAVTYWHVDDIEAVYARLLSLGATQYEPITQRANSNFVTASVIDPFGNVLGIMYNPHYLEIVGTAR
ncbi:VOC family protein [Paraflavitalea pollutisoli]|uniref:VOC family protein n=1 Tax=Paraflavitalea pollutisoli TaxID=3034143 RepID=UPI0023EC97C1|nr:VOC family protein [Paraflavitalea sp. H1-2-19X]